MRRGGGGGLGAVRGCQNGSRGDGGTGQGLLPAPPRSWHPARFPEEAKAEPAKVTFAQNAGAQRAQEGFRAGAGREKALQGVHSALPGDCRIPGGCALKDQLNSPLPTSALEAEP